MSFRSNARRLRPSVVVAACVLLSGTATVQGQEIPAEILQYADLVLYNGKVLTANAGFEVAEAVAVRDGKILAVGGSQRILAMAGKDTVRQDLGGRTVVPGFIGTDGDNDFIGGNLYKETLINGQIMGSLPAKTKEECVAKIRELMRDVPTGEPAFFRFEDNSGAENFTRQELDAIAPKNPVMVTAGSFDSVLNTAMLDQLLERLPKTHPHILKDETGEPNGRIYGFAMGIVGWDLRPWPRIDDALVAQQKSDFGKLLAGGVTTLVGHIQGFSLSVANLLAHRRELDIRIRGSHDFLRQNPFAKAYLRRMGTLVNFGVGEMIKIIGAGLLAVDGDASSGSALTSFPKRASGGFVFGRHGKNNWVGYGANQGNSVEQVLWKDVANRETTEWSAAMAAIQYGWNFAGMHNVGDGATEMWLKTLEEGLQQDLVMKPELRPFSLDHNHFWNDDQMERIKRFDVRRGLGKVFGTPLRSIEMYGDRLHDAQPVPKLIAAGAKVHIEGTDPLREIQEYVTRRDSNGNIWGPAHAIDRKTALWMKTLWAARFFGEEQQLGSIEAGKLADMVVLGQDYLSVPDADIAKIPVVMTIVDGRLVHRQGL
jgi:predicted amidohydrolase YtcJ